MNGKKAEIVCLKVVVVLTNRKELTDELWALSKSW